MLGTGGTDESGGLGNGQETLTVADLWTKVYTLLRASDVFFKEVKSKLDQRFVDYLTVWTDIGLEVDPNNINEHTVKDVALLFFVLGFTSGVLGMNPELSKDREAVFGLSAAVLAVARERVSAKLTSAGTDVPAGSR